MFNYLSKLRPGSQFKASGVLIIFKINNLKTVSGGFELDHPVFILLSGEFTVDISGSCGHSHEPWLDIFMEDLGDVHFVIIIELIIDMGLFHGFQSIYQTCLKTTNEYQSHEFRMTKEVIFINYKINIEKQIYRSSLGG